MKREINLVKAELTPASLFWPHRDECQGKFVLAGINEHGEPVRTSLILGIKGNAVETCNSIYMVNELSGLEQWKEESGHVK